MGRLAFVVLAGGGFAAALVTAPVLGKGRGAGADASAAVALASDAGDGGARRDGGPISRIPPDPSPLSEAHQWIVELRWDKGDVYLVSARSVDLEAPRVTPRVMGRFALELYEGNALVERVRFDFPGLIDGDFVDAGHAESPRIDKKLTSRIGVMFPRTDRGRRFELWDRATDRRWPLAWPPAAGDAGS